MTGIVITTYNRAPYLEMLLRSLTEANLEGAFLLCVDDGSGDYRTQDMIREFERWDAVILKKDNRGICHSLKVGFDFLCTYGCELVMNLDADMIVAPDFLQRITSVAKLHQNCIASGFNTMTADPKTGKPRHKIITQFGEHALKQTIGGANMCMQPRIYRKVVEPVLKDDTYWDWAVCNRMRQMKLPFYVTTPSCLQHIGEISTFPGRGEHDTSNDFYA